MQVFKRGEIVDAVEAIECVACGKAGMHFVRTIRSRRRPANLPLYFCDKCESFAMPSDFHQQIKDPARAIQFHKNILDRNIKWSRGLVDWLTRSDFPTDGLHEIGCGNGALLKVAQDAGIRPAVGFEMNPHMAYFAQQLDVDIRPALWSAQVDAPPARLLAALSVFEHINDPRPLAREMAEYGRRHKAFAIINTPIIRDTKWRYVFTPYERGSPFDAADSHVLYFSPEGLPSLLKSAGAVAVRRKRVGGWNVHVCAFTVMSAAFLDSDNIDWSPVAGL